MIPIKHPHCNAVLARPANMTEEECRDLHIRREDGNVWSFWKPNDEELLALNRGGSVALAVMGETHPPLSVMVARPFEPFDRAPTEAEYRHRMGAVNGRMSALMDITKRIVAGWVREANDSPHRQHLVNQFLDLINLNRADGEIVEGMPKPEPDQPTEQQLRERADAYRDDALEWKAEAERWRKVAEEATEGDESRFQLEADLREMQDELTKLKAEASKADRLLATVRSTIYQLNASMAEFPNPNHPS